MSVLKGVVVSGMGNFSYWLEKLESFYTQKTGLRLFPGTLNLKLEQAYSLPAQTIRLEKEEYGGTVSVSMVPCRVFDRPAFLLRTDANEAGAGHHPKNIIEIATDIKLREAYQLRDGDEVEVHI
ncbi:CTP-dependent riboflavin kinase [Acidobacterium sp. S8]|uniref:CTP-dependent riboflavin kinase n=1 Tax=Acidobacterium sp. S8 TaxID=1641854 RepID=UPI0020B128D2|nr:CTP-dependent riboflavin kinase [Acidobacterium sp. S8]